ncbi:MAG: NAD-dependent epimerase/dehydratase family protein [Hyphomicrobiales bacterium]
MPSVDVAITGATGFVGGHLIDRLIGNRLGVRLLVRTPENLNRDDVDVVEGDLASPDALERLCEGADTVVHCAGRIAACSRAEFDEVNVAGTAALLAAARARGVRRFVHISSLAAREPSVSDYAASKRAGEVEVRGVEGDMSWIILRPPAVYGPGDRATLPLIKQLTQPIAFVPGSRNGRASLIHVRDLAAAIAHVVARDTLAQGIYELDDGKRDGYSWRELTMAAAKARGRKVRCVFLPKSMVKLAGHVEMAIARRRGRTPEVTPGKVSELYHPDWVCRHNLLQERSDWVPAVGLSEGLQETTAWYRQEGWL